MGQGQRGRTTGECCQDQGTPIRHAPKPWAGLERPRNKPPPMRPVRHSVGHPGRNAKTQSGSSCCRDRMRRQPSGEAPRGGSPKQGELPYTAASRLACPALWSAHCATKTTDLSALLHSFPARLQRRSQNTGPGGPPEARRSPPTLRESGSRSGGATRAGRLALSHFDQGTADTRYLVSAPAMEMQRSVACTKHHRKDLRHLQSRGGRRIRPREERGSIGLGEFSGRS